MKIIPVLLFNLILFLAACTTGTQKEKAPEQTSVGNWYDDATIYEVNVRQYTPEGTFNAFAEHLPRLKKLGVEILWIMPVHPISEKNRKGSLGSYYAVADYKGINPEFGTMDDFKALVKKCHDMDMKVIIDWVANHTGWDNPWIFEHPEWYTKDSTGAIIPPNPDWADIADLNFDVPEMRRAMIDAMDFWLEEANIDGFRCDVAWGVPADFWDDARASFDSIKPVFMLAEDEDHPGFLNYAFQSNYAWHLHHIMNKVAKGESSAKEISEYYATPKYNYPNGLFPMHFITNHDENSWQGTIKERMGYAGDAFAVLSFTIPGMPLIYSGQEVGLNKRLLFFEKDEIDWETDISKVELYTNLVNLKKENKALWNGSAGGKIEFLKTSDDKKLIAYTRKKDDNEILVVLNLSSTEFSGLINVISGGIYKCYNSNETLETANKIELSMKPWEYKIWIKK